MCGFLAVSGKERQVYEGTGTQTIPAKIETQRTTSLAWSQPDTQRDKRNKRLCIHKRAIACINQVIHTHTYSHMYLMFTYMHGLHERVTVGWTLKSSDELHTECTSLLNYTLICLI